jgi:carbamoyltransferase
MWPIPPRQTLLPTRRLPTKKVSRENPRDYRMINKFGRATGVPAVTNASFNRKGEPIGNIPANAYNVLSGSEMNALMLENFIIEKN